VIKRVFVDSDVILDVALARQPFLDGSRMLLSLLENNIALGFISANCVANIYYFLRKSGGDSKARLFISNLLKYLTVSPVDHSNIVSSLKSEFSDFEDAIQYNTAIENNIKILLTRNLKDYKKALIQVMNPETFLSGQ